MFNQSIDFQGVNYITIIIIIHSFFIVGFIMLKRLILIFIGVTIAVCIQAHLFAHKYSSIHYRISPVSGAEIPTIKIEAEITGLLSQELIIDLPYRRGRSFYTEQVKNITLEDPSLIFTINRSDCHKLRIVLPRRMQRIKISYEMNQNNDNSTHINDAIIRHDVVHSTSSGLFAIPTDVKGSDKIQFSISWDNFPETWHTLSSFGVKSCLQFSATVSQFMDAFYAAGALRLYEIKDERSGPVFLSLYGSFDIADEKIKDSVAEIIETQRSFFNDFDFPYYVISLIQGNNSSMGGRALQSSFAAFLPNRVDYKDFYLLFAHEYFHNWFGGKISNTENDVDDKLNYWWQEGFTDYYARVLAMRSGGISIEDFMSECNELLSNYYLSPMINEPNALIKDSFWKDNDIQKLPYLRGFVFALYLNGCIKQNDGRKSIDNITFDLFKVSQQEKFSVKLFKKIAQSYIPQGIEREITEFIENGKTIDLSDVSAVLPVVKVLVDERESYQLSSMPDDQVTIKNFFDMQ